MPDTSIISFFNQISDAYDDLVARSIPRYKEMFWAMLYYLPQDFQPKHILELGCGTGNLTLILADRWPQAKITAVDFSVDMLQKTAERMAPRPVECVEAAFEKLSLPSNEYDLIISSIAVHHISDADKAVLIKNSHDWLKPGGFFVLGDQVRGVTPRLYAADVAFYEAYAKDSGASDEDVSQWRAHREQMDHYATLNDLQAWLRDANFQNIEVLWRYCFWAALQAQKV